MMDLMVSDVAKFEYEQRLAQMELERRLLAEGEDAPRLASVFVIGWR